MTENKNLTIAQRLTAPTSGFFKKVRTIGLVLAADGGALVAAPVSLPAIVVTIAGYLTVAGGVMTAVSQVTVEGE
jgi:ABC-type xylose transport system permease subunit